LPVTQFLFVLVFVIVIALKKTAIFALAKSLNFILVAQIVQQLAEPMEIQ